LGLSRRRIESLLTAFPRLIKSGQQHTYVENENVRFIYQPVEAYYLVLITNLNSNILEDMDTLQMLAKTLSEQCSSTITEQFLKEKYFEIMIAFDEIVGLGYREHLTMNSLKTILAMESHEEMIQEIIARVIDFMLLSDLLFRIKCRKPRKRLN
jgi:hypothetical protein